MEKSEHVSWKEKWIMGGRNKWLILILGGLLLIVISLPASSKKESSESRTVLLEKENVELEKTQLETKLEVLLKTVEGVGNAEVMLMTGDTEETGFYVSSAPMKVTGVLIAAEGADDYTVVRNIQEAVMALFQVDAHKIKVMKMK